MTKYTKIRKIYNHNGEACFSNPEGKWYYPGPGYYSFSISLILKRGALPIIIFPPVYFLFFKEFGTEG